MRAGDMVCVVAEEARTIALNYRAMGCFGNYASGTAQVADNGREGVRAERERLRAHFRELWGVECVMVIFTDWRGSR